MENPQDPLDSMLERWRATTPEPSDALESKTWRRIAVAQAEPSRSPGLLASIEAIFARPSFTVAFVAACILLGLFIAQARTSDLHAARSRQVVQNYLRVIDPLVEAEVSQPAPSIATEDQP
jgi:hypothetical protein